MQPQAKYRLGNLEADWVKSKREVRQGCILPPTLFCLYTEELAVRIRMNAGEDKLCVLYADDVILSGSV